jgi:hypothetical protein
MLSTLVLEASLLPDSLDSRLLSEAATFRLSDQEWDFDKSISQTY